MLDGSGTFSGAAIRRAITRASVHVGSKNGIDPRLTAPFPAEPFDKVGVQPHRHGFLRRGITTRASFQKASSVGFASGSSMIAACPSSSVIEQRRRQSVLGSVVEVVPEVSSLMRFGPSC